MNLGEFEIGGSAFFGSEYITRIRNNSGLPERRQLIIKRQYEKNKVRLNEILRH